MTPEEELEVCFNCLLCKKFSFFVAAQPDPYIKWEEFKLLGEKNIGKLPNMSCSAGFFEKYLPSGTDALRQCLLRTPACRHYDEIEV
jgi:hypothetical protein